MNNDNIDVPASATTRKPVVKERVGEVISDKMDKTIVVRVARRIAHPRYRKIITVHKNYYAHDEKNEARVGDIVRIRETRPLSRLKRWQLVSIDKKAEPSSSTVQEVNL
ncbi:MAG: 30S ribosomal protein S17 [Methylacidiphilales bacterium]|nr:30S ribosomal protein S17 [Candidatus Methylacidiphilales bacterium]MDW8348979.1 30S ribosomal protein S17 [Verrucomicrobiae bacterium]